MHGLAMGMPMYEGLDGMFLHGLDDGGLSDIGDAGRLFAERLDRAGAHIVGDAPAQRERQQGINALDGRASDKAAPALVADIVSAEGVAVHKQYFLAAERERMRIGDQFTAAGLGKGPVQVKIAVAAHEIKPRLRAGRIVF